MKTTRICVGIAVWILLMVTFLQLDKIGFFAEASANMDGELLALATKYLSRFSPVGWWSYLTPVALAVAIAAALRVSLPKRWLFGILAGSVMIGFVLWVLYWFIEKLTSAINDDPPSTLPPIPVENLATNIALLGTAIGLAAWSVVKLWKSRNPSFQRNDS